MATQMDKHFADHFQWLRALPSLRQPSWHSYTYGLTVSMAEELKTQMRIIRASESPFEIRFNPEIALGEVEGFIKGDGTTARARSCCHSVSTRLNVDPSGAVTTCKLFQEFTIGNLRDSSVMDLWASHEFVRARKALTAERMPICSQCVQFYQHGE